MRPIKLNAVCPQGIPLTSQGEMLAFSHTAAWHITCRSLLHLQCASRQSLSGAVACCYRWLTCALIAMAFWLHGMRCAARFLDRLCPQHIR